LNFTSRCTYLLHSQPIIIMRWTMVHCLLYRKLSAAQFGSLVIEFVFFQAFSLMSVIKSLTLMNSRSFWSTFWQEGSKEGNHNLLYLEYLAL
jgi:hypothetical protein